MENPQRINVRGGWHREASLQMQLAYIQNRGETAHRLLLEGDWRDLWQQVAQSWHKLGAKCLLDLTLKFA